MRGNETKAIPTRLACDSSVTYHARSGDHTIYLVEVDVH